MLLVEILKGAQVLVTDGVRQRLTDAELNALEQRHGGSRVAEELLMLLLLRRRRVRLGCAGATAHAVVLTTTR